MSAKRPDLPQRLKTKPAHYSYLKHRRQATRQIVLPVALSALALVALTAWIGYATFNQNGDVGRWAAISTIWIVIPIMFGGLIVLAFLGALIYGMARLLDVLPHYTNVAQNYVFIARGYILRGARAAVKPIRAVNRWMQTAKTFFERIVP
ncbi:MAG: hypothetical protein LC099_10300 [Anaerolineales bacterium]|nr:hypothetical protein [Anaerolineales bacterium]